MNFHELEQPASFGARHQHTPLRRVLPTALAMLAVIAWMALAPKALAQSATATTTTPSVKLPASATLDQCVTSTEQTERSATFAGEMTAIKGATKMEMRVDVLEKMPRELVFHALVAPGLGVWRIAAAGVSTYKYLKEITNLAAPASYRAVVRFRWLNAKSHLVKSIELRTPRCAQPVTPGGGRKALEEPQPPTGV
jgi:hypothetical protein